ncbi:hypothetical protein HORIV_52600 [Vreelandella olivaria]|uniref:Uncharacterized protein n=1 Tax=Vreelandella olivaria TaxID=390919 RepID=A0ABN5X0S6_9GAMM|nr:hypothetical protein HORIV_52600 [Halomonas olivaria]
MALASGFYSVLLLLTFGFAFTALQSYAVATSFGDAFGVPVLYSGIALAMLVGLIIFGGIKRIARISEFLVPFMAVSYIAIALLVIAMNITEIPGVIALIVKSAFGLEPLIGGGIGAAIMMGLKRGLFSNEAGLGSAPNVAAVAYVPHPANQGIVQAFSVFIDTVIICSATAFLILLSGAYDPTAGAGVEGIALTQAALADHVGEWGAPLLAWRCCCLLSVPFSITTTWARTALTSSAATTRTCLTLSASPLYYWCAGARPPIWAPYLALLMSPWVCWRWST